MKIKEYMTVTSSHSKISDIVNEFIGEGWQPFGGVSVATELPHPCNQAMVKYEEKDKENKEQLSDNFIENRGFTEVNPTQKKIVDIFVKYSDFKWIIDGYIKSLKNKGFEMISLIENQRESTWKFTLKMVKYE